MAFSRREYWSGLPCPLQEIFLTQGLYLGLLHRQAILYHSATREASLVQGKEQIGSRRAKMLPSLFSFQGLTPPPTLSPHQSRLPSGPSLRACHCGHGRDAVGPGPCLVLCRHRSATVISPPDWAWWHICTEDSMRGSRAEASPGCGWPQLYQ